MSYLLDTNIISFIVKCNPRIILKLEDIKAENISIFMSCITYFEIKRGLLAVNSPKQKQRFEALCQDYQIIFLDELAILEKAAEIHANLRLRGLPIQTEDILIAATAMIKKLTVVSNDSDFLRVEGLSLENWTQE